MKGQFTRILPVNLESNVNPEAKPDGGRLWYREPPVPRVFSPEVAIKKRERGGAIISKVMLMVFIGCILHSGPSWANERLFTYTYESPVLPAGALEIELWTTPHLMRDHYYARFDQRIEFEVGPGGKVQTAFYLNSRGLAETSPEGMKKRYDFRGVSPEWKWQMSDPTADWLGSALYGEVTWMPHELEIEAKLILDRWIGPVLFGYNLVVEYEIEAEQAQGEEMEWEKTVLLENILGASLRVANGFQVRMEILNRNRILEGNLDWIIRPSSWDRTCPFRAAAGGRH
jgi:hypothetical protein